MKITPLETNHLDESFGYLIEKSENEAGHSDIEGAIELKSAIKPSKMVISHIGHRNLFHKKLVSIMSLHNIEVGFDRMVINL